MFAALAPCTLMQPVHTCGMHARSLLVFHTQASTSLFQPSPASDATPAAGVPHRPHRHHERHGASSAAALAKAEAVQGILNTMSSRADASNISTAQMDLDENTVMEVRTAKRHRPLLLYQPLPPLHRSHRWSLCHGRWVVLSGWATLHNYRSACILIEETLFRLQAAHEVHGCSPPPHTQPTLAARRVRVRD